MTKTLTISDEVFKKLVSVKGKHESFSELFERLVKERSPEKILKTLRGSIELTNSEKKTILVQIGQRRDQRRS